MPVGRCFVFSLALGGVTIMWLACNSGTARPQISTSAGTQNQNAVIPLDERIIFRDYCAACHGVHGNGDGPVAPVLNTKVPQLTTLAQRNGGAFLLPGCAASSPATRFAQPTVHGRCPSGARSSTESNTIRTWDMSGFRM